MYFDGFPIPETDIKIPADDIKLNASVAWLYPYLIVLNLKLLDNNVNLILIVILMHFQMKPLSKPY